MRFIDEGHPRAPLHTLPHAKANICLWIHKQDLIRHRLYLDIGISSLQSMDKYIAYRQLVPE